MKPVSYRIMRVEFSSGRSGSMFRDGWGREECWFTEPDNGRTRVYGASKDDLLSAIMTQSVKKIRPL